MGFKEGFYQHKHLQSITYLEKVGMGIQLIGEQKYRIHDEEGRNFEVKETELENLLGDNLRIENPSELLDRLEKRTGFVRTKIKAIASKKQKTSSDMIMNESPYLL